LLSGLDGIGGLSGHGLSVLIAPEAIEVSENAEHGVAVAARDEVVQRDAQRVHRTHHVKDFVLDVLQRHRLLPVRAQLLLNRLLPTIKSH
jgi:hypothetical protein